MERDEPEKPGSQPPPGMPSVPPPGMPSAPPPSPGGPQSPAPGPQSPAPGGPQSPAPGATPPAPPAPESPPPGPQTPPAPPGGGYTGPVPPGGWQQPVQQPVMPGGQLASWGSRLGAILIDGLVLLVPASILALLILGTTVDDDEVDWLALAVSTTLYLFALGIVSLLYGPLLMMRDGEHNGKTWGKQVLGIRVVRDNGQPMSFGIAALREVVLKQIAVGIASFIIPILPYFLNYFWPLWDDENRALHDMAASTHVVKA